MNKTISVNPSFFNITNKKNRTRKAKNADPNMIKFKPQQPPRTNKMVKKTILKFIRNKQQQRYNDMQKPVQEIQHNPYSRSDNVIPQTTHPNSDFEESLKYLTDIANETKPPQNNTTLKKTTGYVKDSDSLFNSYIGNITGGNNKEPPYGCLKQHAGGIKPTYRQYVRNTIKTNQPTVSPLSQIQQQQPFIQQQQQHEQPFIQQTHYQQPQPQHHIQHTSTPPTPIYTPPTEQPAQSPPIYKYRNIIDRTEELVKLKNKHKESLKEPVRRKKRRIIKNRTFKTGKRHNTLSVLLPTKTKRNETLCRSRDLKTVPLNDIKKELIKQGLIRVGTTTPPNVLRKMYETINLICGKVKNHNPENLLYNFINDVA